MPRDIAQKIIDNVPKSNIIESVGGNNQITNCFIFKLYFQTSIAGPGFINIKLNKAFFSKNVRKILTKGVLLEKAPRKLKVRLLYDGRLCKCTQQII